MVKQENADIHWGGETGLQTDANVEKGYSLKGKTPVSSQTAKRERINMISSITNQGQVRFMFYRDNMNSTLLIDFMRHLTKDDGRKVSLILGNLKVLHSKVVKVWLVKHHDKIKLFYLPSSSPELNPEEHLNNSLKRRIHSGERAHNANQLESKVKKHIQTLQNDCFRTMNFLNIHASTMRPDSLGYLPEQ